MAGRNREYKDRLFKFIFGNEKNKEWTLSLYNAINDSDYTDAESIKFTTVDDALYISMKNDVSFLISQTLMFFEQQSTFNPNMPLRYLMYAGMSYSKYLEMNSLFIYSSRPLDIPAPRCICFYNGEKESEDKIELRFSDLCKEKSDIELVVTMININYGRNRELLEKCKPLGEYSWFVAEVRANQKIMSFEDAVDKALEDMPDDFLIKPFLMANKSEVETMCITEFDEARYTEQVKEEGIEIGIGIGEEKGEKRGIVKGRTEGSMKTLLNLLKKGLINEDNAAEDMGMTVENFRKAAAVYCN